MTEDEESAGAGALGDEEEETTAADAKAAGTKAAARKEKKAAKKKAEDAAAKKAEDEKVLREIEEAWEEKEAAEEKAAEEEATQEATEQDAAKLAEKFGPLEKKMKGEGLGDAAIQAFKYSYSLLLFGGKGLIAESSIAPAEDVPRLEEVRASITPDTTLLKETAVVKLNGGLGTGMGLDKAKSLLQVKDDDTFLDLIAKQVEPISQAVCVCVCMCTRAALLSVPFRLSIIM